MMKYLIRVFSISFFFLATLSCVGKEELEDSEPRLSTNITAAQYVSSVGGTVYIRVKSNVEWQVSSSDIWAVIQNKKGSKDGTVGISVGRNDGESSRQCTISVSSQKTSPVEIKIIQYGKKDDPTVAADYTQPKPYLNPAGNEFPILAWFSIYGDYLTGAKFKEMEEAGFNISLSQLHNLPDIKKALNAARSSKVKIMVDCQKYADTNEERIKDLVWQIKGEEALAGYALRDEPVMSQFNLMRNLSDAVRKIDDSHFIYINLLPNYAGTEILGGSYTEYLTNFIEMTNLRYVSFDFYPVLMNGVRDNFYSNLEVAREVTESKEVPFWAFILSTGHGDVYPRATYESMSFQLYNNLAYGAQGIEYFTYIRPGEGNPAEASFWNCPGILDYGGKKTEIYDYVKRLNSEIKALTPVFLGADVIDVSHTRDDKGNLPNWRTHELKTLPTNVSKVESDGAGIAVSHFRNSDREYMLIASHTPFSEQNVTVEFSSPVKKIERNGSKKGIPANESCIISLEKGGMLLYELK